MHNKLLYKPTILICSLLLWISCSTGNILISVLQPASIIIPRDIKSISVLPVAGIPGPPGVFDSINPRWLDPAYDYNITKRGYLYGVYDALASSPRFQRIVLTDTCVASIGSSGIISWKSLKEICRHDSTNGILLLKKAVSTDAIKPGLEDYQYQEVRIRDDGIVFPVYGSGLFLSLINSTRWSFYQPDSQITTPTITYADTIEYYNDIGTSTFLSHEKLRGLLYDACFYTGSEVGRKLAPVWDDEVQRILYIGPEKPIRKAAELARHNKWAEAGQIWDSLASGNNSRMVFKASFNTALAWEQADDLDQALIWIKYTDSLRRSVTVKTYRQILEKRLQDRALLDIQMTGD